MSQSGSVSQAGRGGSGSKLGRAAFAGAVVLAVLIGLLYFMTGGKNGGDEAVTDTSVLKELKASDYKKIKDDTREDAGRTLQVQEWERSGPPERIIVAESSYMPGSVFVVDEVIYGGADGGPGLKCRPNPEHAMSPLAEIVADSDKIRVGVKDGSQKPAETASGLPYAGVYVDCATA